MYILIRNTSESANVGHRTRGPNVGATGKELEQEILIVRQVGSETSSPDFGFRNRIVRRLPQKKIR